MPEDFMHLLPPRRHWSKGGDRPVLALHCSLAHAGAWSGLVEHLTGVSVTAFDQIGHGRAAPWNGVVDLHGEATREAIGLAEDIGQGGPVDLFGHSFGGTVALRVALERPDLVRSLMLVEPVLFAAAKAAGAAEWPEFEAGHAKVAALFAAGQPEAAAGVFHGLWGTGEPLSALPERSRHYIVDRIGLIPAQNGVLLEDSAQLLRPGGLEGVRKPVLLVEGGDSPAIIAAIHTALCQRLPQARRAVVEGAGHMVPLTHARALAALVQAHLDAS